MTFRRLWPYPAGGPDREARAVAGQEEIRRATSTNTRLAEGTLACARCDAPIAIGDSRLSVAAELSCPYCLHRAPVRDFLSLEPPTRPTRVIVRIALRSR